MEENQPEEEPFYEVESIINKRKYEGRVEYLIKWKGYPLEDSTWEDYAHLQSVKPLIKYYNEMAKERRRCNGNFSFDTPTFLAKEPQEEK